MRILLFISILLVCTSVRAQKSTETPDQVVQRQLDAYNARNIDAFIDTYSDSVKLYQFPITVFSQGKDQIRAVYKPFFDNNPKLHCEIKKRIVQGNTVIDQERVTGLADGSVIEATAIYRIENGKISEVFFIR